MNRPLAVTAWLLASTGIAAAGGTDASMDRYFAIWADNSRVTPQAVDRVYAGRVVYYGRTMTRAEVYRDKLNYIRQWPDRRYAVVPGSVSRSCNEARTACTMTAVLSWEKADPKSRAGAKGANTITLDLVLADGTLKIARESGSPLARSDCRSRGGAWSCAAYR